MSIGTFTIMTLIVYKRLKHSEALRNMENIEKWFRNNPKKRVCKTDLFNVRRGYIVKDILKHTKPLPKEK